MLQKSTVVIVISWPCLFSCTLICAGPNILLSSQQFQDTIWQWMIVDPLYWLVLKFFWLLCPPPPSDSEIFLFLSLEEGCTYSNVTCQIVVWLALSATFFSSRFFFLVLSRHHHHQPIFIVNLLRPDTSQETKGAPIILDDWCLCENVSQCDGRFWTEQNSKKINGMHEAIIIYICIVLMLIIILKMNTFCIYCMGNLACWWLKRLYINWLCTCIFSLLITGTLLCWWWCGTSSVSYAGQYLSKMHFLFTFLIFLQLVLEGSAGLSFWFCLISIFFCVSFLLHDDDKNVTYLHNQ